MSLLFALSYVASATDGSTPGTFERLISTRGGAQARRFVEGAQTISVRMARSLGHGHVVLDAPVRRDRASTPPRRRRALRTRARGTRSTSSSPYPAPRGAGSTTPRSCGPNRDLMTQRFAIGSAHQGRGGLRPAVVAGCGTHRVRRERHRAGEDVLRRLPRDGSLGVLLGFVGGDMARRYAGRHRKLRHDVLANFALVLRRRPGPHTRMHVLIQDWPREEWTRGCPTTLAPPGSAHGVRTTDRRAGRAHPLGRHRDGDVLEGLHGRRSARG